MEDFVPRGTSSKDSLERSTEKLRAFETILEREADKRGLLGPKDLEIVWERHILNCLPLVELIPANATLADLGSGAGLPGLVIAIAREDLKITLVEPMERRVTFLKEVIEELNLTNVEVIQGRAESLSGKRKFDFVTARAVAPMKKLVKLAVPLLNKSGLLLAIKGEKANSELNEALSQIKELKATSLGVVKIGSGINTEISVVVIKAGASG
jgi:16S rRNA (guanine527-N7)-methyltransferase